MKLLLGCQRLISVALPPVADTRFSPNPPSQKTITPSRFQVPPDLAPETSHTVCTGPPETSIFLSLPPAKKPIDRLSGDQKG